MPRRWDIFCKVVDNLGDIGVCWRLARMLHTEHGLPVRLWVDDLAAHQRICPQVVIADTQEVEGIEVRHWALDAAPTDVADVVIDAFGCGLPPAYLANATPQTVWVNLEYLSAEPWVAQCHALSSQPAGAPMPRRFFFPGFEARTGGLMREGDLMTRRLAFDADPHAAARFLARLGVAERDALRVFLFCYPNNNLPVLLEAFAAGPQAVQLIIPKGQVAEQVARILGPGLARGSLHVQVIDYVPQPDFDNLLWSMDLNFVRGEDSFVRAQWAARPFVWHIYPQDERAHLAKLDAFLHRYAADCSACEPLIDFTRAWNDGGLTSKHWQGLLPTLPALRTHARQWSDTLCILPELTNALVQFCAKPV